MYLLSLVFFLQPPKPNHPVGSACSRLPWLVAPPPPYRTLKCWPVHPSLPPHVMLFSGNVSPNTHLHPNQSTLVLPSLRLDRRIFHGSCPFRPRPRCRPPPWFARHARCAALLRCQRCQGTTSIRRGLYVERLTTRSTAAARKCILIMRKIMIPPPDSRDPPDGPPYFAPLTAGTHLLHLHTQGSA